LLQLDPHPPNPASGYCIKHSSASPFATVLAAGTAAAFCDFRAVFWQKEAVTVALGLFAQARFPNGTSFPASAVRQERGKITIDTTPSRPVG
jgi:hypothetical protein